MSDIPSPSIVTTKLYIKHSTNSLGALSIHIRQNAIRYYFYVVINNIYALGEAFDNVTINLLLPDGIKSNESTILIEHVPGNDESSSALATVIHSFFSFLYQVSSPSLSLLLLYFMPTRYLYPRLSLYHVLPLIRMQ